MPDIDIQITDNSGEILKKRTAWNAKDLTGQKFGRLTVISRANNHITSGGNIIAKWLCKCECGNTCEVSSQKLRSGRTNSCGCLSRELTSKRSQTHNKSHTRIYNIWRNIKARCYNPKNAKYYCYGARNIAVCESWRKDFNSFYEWAINNGYSDNLTIDRINNDGNYEPSNCRWATNAEQANNKSNNRTIEYNGESHTLAEWAKLKNLSYKSLSLRINTHHWDVERALNQPMRRRKHE